MANVLMTENCRTIPASGRSRMNWRRIYSGPDGHADDGRRPLDPGFECGRVCAAWLFRDESFVGNTEEFCAPPPPPDADSLASLPCSAGHTACYVSPYGEFYPCVQFPLSCGNVRQQRFIDIWRNSEQLKEVRSICLKDLSGCSQCAHGSTCTRCPGLASMEGNMRGPSTADCEKSFARTGIPSANLIAKKEKTSLPRLVQIQIVPTIAGNRLSSMSNQPAL